jgi:hypothetical protein
MRVLRAIGRTLGIILIVIVSYAGWYCIAANYDYGALAGTYILKLNGETYVLCLRADKTFTDKLIGSGNTKQSEGTWRRIGEGGVVFSSEFLNISGERLRADGQVDGEFSKILGLLPTLNVSKDKNGSSFHKKWFF